VLLQRSVDWHIEQSGLDALRLNTWFNELSPKGQRYGEDDDV
jgi:hypothetical protein